MTKQSLHCATSHSVNLVRAWQLQRSDQPALRRKRFRSSSPVHHLSCATLKQWALVAYAFLWANHCESCRCQPKCHCAFKWLREGVDTGLPQNACTKSRLYVYMHAHLHAWFLCATIRNIWANLSSSTSFTHHRAKNCVFVTFQFTISLIIVHLLSRFVFLQLMTRQTVWLKIRFNNNLCVFNGLLLIILYMWDIFVSWDMACNISWQF